MDEKSYAQKLAEEAEVWGSAAAQQASALPPDWRHHRSLRHNVIIYSAHIDALLEQIRPGTDVLELGCSAGWLTLAMAERGAQARGIDIAGKALEIARAYAESAKDALSGTVSYQAADLNAVQLPAESYDVIVAKGILHHLMNTDSLVHQVYKALKPGGLFWVTDIHGDEAGLAVWIAGTLTFLLPTRVSYRQKIQGLIRVGLHAPQRLRASMQAEGLSPFEGIGRKTGWLELIRERFTIEKCLALPAFTGYVAEELKLPDVLAMPLLRILGKLDTGLVRCNLLRSTGIVLYARKGGAPRASS